MNRAALSVFQIGRSSFGVTRSLSRGESRAHFHGGMFCTVVCGRSSAISRVQIAWGRRVLCIALVGVALCFSACTSWALHRSTASVASSVGTIIEEQVVENLDRFYDAPYSIPSQVVLSQGVVQVQNQLTSALKLPYTLTQKSSKEGDLGANMQWQEAWTIVPVTDSEDIYRLQYLYRGAVRNIRSSRIKTDEEDERDFAPQYLPFSTTPNDIGDPLPGKCPSPPSSIFENCDEIKALLGKSSEWLAFDRKPAGSQADLQYAGDDFVTKRGNGIHRIWVRPREFSKFVMYVLYATPKSKVEATTTKVPAIFLP